MGVDSVTIVIPAFNEAARITSTLRDLCEYGRHNIDIPWEIIVVSDGSTDNTAAIVSEFGKDHPQVRVISEEFNRGKGTALQLGFRSSNGDAVCFVDADLPVASATIFDMAHMCDDDDLILGSRRIDGAHFVVPQPFARRVGGKAFLAISQALGFTSCSDPQCGVKALNRQSMTDVIGDVVAPGFSFDIELVELARRHSKTIKEVPVQWSHVDGSSLRPARDAVFTLRELVDLRRRLRHYIPQKVA